MQQYAVRCTKWLIVIEMHINDRKDGVMTTNILMGPTLQLGPASKQINMKLKLIIFKVEWAEMML